MAIKQNFSPRGYLILDTSYFNHYMIGRAFNHYEKHFDVPSDKKELWEIDFSTVPEFLSILAKTYLDGLNFILRSYNIKMGNIIFATDCHIKNCWRMDIFPEYKIDRLIKKSAKEGLNKSPLHKFIGNILLPKILRKRNYGFLLNNDYAEGDDIIAISKNYLREKYPEMEIVVLTNDSDMLQLHDSKTHLYNFEHYDIMKRSIGSIKKDLMYKIILGDTSDSIPSCFQKVKGDKVLCRGCGKKTAKKLVDDVELLKEKFKQYPDAVKVYKRNKSIIDLDLIPKEIVRDVLNILEERI